MIYIILAHREPKMLRALIKKLQEPSNYFIIHVDMREHIDAFEAVTKDLENCFFLEKRFQSQWGSFALVEATLEGLSYVRSKLKKKQRVILLSGSDLPIKQNETITKFLRKDKDAIYIEYDPIPKKEWYNGGINRFPMYDQVSKEMDFYGGSQWFSIPYKVIAIIFQFLKINPDFLMYFKFVKISDESFFQTLLLNCGHPFVKDNIRNENLHYIRWSHPYIHPDTLTLEFLDDIRRSDRLFARKFSLEISKALVDNLH